MIISEFVAETGLTLKDQSCTACHTEEAVIQMHCYSEDGVLLCTDCAMQLARKLMEDLCAVLTRGGRHG